MREEGIQEKAGGSGDLCPRCGAPMIAGRWEGPLPVMETDGAELRFGRLGQPALICGPCSLTRLTAEIEGGAGAGGSAGPEGDTAAKAAGKPCWRCGAPTILGSMDGAMPTFRTDYDGLVRVSTEGSPKATVCVPCGLVDMLFKGFRVQSRDSAALERWVRDKATAGRVTRRLVFCCALVAGIAVPTLLTGLALLTGVKTGGFVGALSLIMSVPLIWLSLPIAAMIGGGVGLWLGTRSARLRGLPLPWWDNDPPRIRAYHEHRLKRGGR